MPIRPRGLRRRRRAPAIVAALAAFACPAPAPAFEHTRMEPVWFEAVAPDGEAGHAVPALLNLPPGWMIGDAAVLVLSDGPWPGLARERLVASLLGEQAAVLEFDVNTARNTARQAGPDHPRAGPEPTAAELAVDVRAAVQLLRRDTGAGLVVALGHGMGGDAALLAASSERTATADRDRAGLVAAASLGPDGPRFALGGAAPGRSWPVRAERLCQVLAGAAAPAEPVRRADADCRRALVGPGAAFAGRTKGR